jgi:hypothetical protein
MIPTQTEPIKKASIKFCSGGSSGGHDALHSRPGYELTKLSVVVNFELSCSWFGVVQVEISQLREVVPSLDLVLPPMMNLDIILKMIPIPREVT